MEKNREKEERKGKEKGRGRGRRAREGQTKGGMGPKIEVGECFFFSFTA